MLKTSKASVSAMTLESICKGLDNLVDVRIEACSNGEETKTNDKAVKTNF